MLCSKCSGTVKPVVAIDIDGTLGQYHDHFVRFACRWLDKAPLDLATDDRAYDGSIPFKDWFRDVFHEDHTTFRAIKLAYRQGGMKRTVQRYPWADQLTTELRRAGAEVWLTTTRPHERFDRVDPDTREWIRRNNIEFDGLIFDRQKYDVLAERVDRGRVVAVLDDLQPALERAGEIWGSDVPILRRTKFNRGVDTSFRWALNLHEAYEIINSRLEAWSRRYGS